MLEGDAAAFNELYLDLRDSIYSFVYRMVDGYSAAEDILQETFIFFIEYPEKYRPERGSLFSFLCGVARNKTMHHLRKCGNLLETGTDAFADCLVTEDNTMQSPLKVLLEREFETKVEESLKSLSPLLREVLILRELHEFSYQEIAAISEENINTVKVRLHRARRIMAGLLAPYVKGKGNSCHAMY